MLCFVLELHDNVVGVRLINIDQGYTKVRWFVAEKRMEIDSTIVYCCASCPITEEPRCEKTGLRGF